MTPKEVRALCLAVRAKHDMTQTELGNALGVSYVTVNRWENGQSIPHSNQIFKLTGMRENDAKTVKLTWIRATLLNDEASSDAEMVKYFAKAGPMAMQEAWFYVRQRAAALKMRMAWTLKPYPTERKQHKK